MRQTHCLRLFLQNYFQLRRYSVKSPFSQTVLLPKTTFPQKLGTKISEHEIEIQKVCGFDKLYRWQKENMDDSKKFILHDGPPYANGDLHVGHALNKILKDILNRYKLLRGFLIHYKPGWDCHGLPIEIKAIKSKDFKSLSPTQIRQKARSFAAETILKQKHGFKRWGVLADWEDNSNCYYTFDNSYQAKEIEAFYAMFKKDLIYRDLKPVYWSPSSETALAEAELEYNEKHVSRSVYVNFELTNSNQLLPLLSNNDPSLLPDNHKLNVLVWTTQPWTLPANQCLCYKENAKYCVAKSNRDDKDLFIFAVNCLENIQKLTGAQFQILSTFDGSCLNGLTCSHPMNRDITSRLIASDHATTDMGTGVVHTAPAHGTDDFEVAQNHQLPTESHVNNQGFFTSEAGSDLEGKFIFTDGNEKVIETLMENNKLFHEHDSVHSYPYDWRTKKPIFVKTSRQWFIDTKSIQAQAKSSLDDVKFYPANGKQAMTSRLMQRPYWCISRQRVWGLPIPVFYHKKTGETVINDITINHLISLFRNNGADVWWDRPITDLLPDDVIKRSGLRGNSEDYERGKDILDIWFDSGTSWAAVLSENGTLHRPRADFYVEGKDQYGGWFQSSLLTSAGLRGKAPYKGVIVHGFAVAENGQKMSKSLGNVVDPLVLTEGGKNKQKQPAYGADTLRWWVAESNIYNEVQISNSLMASALQDVGKIRNCLRFLLANLEGFDPGKDVKSTEIFIDHYFLHELNIFADKVTEAYEDINYGKVCRLVVNFVKLLSNNYFTTVKDRLYCELEKGEMRSSCLNVLHQTLNILTKSIAPILPHLAEEVNLHNSLSRCESVFKDGWFAKCDIENYSNSKQVIESAFQVKQAFHSLITPSQSHNYDVTIEVYDEQLVDNLKFLQLERTSFVSQLREILICSHSTLVTSPPTNVTSSPANMTSPPASVTSTTKEDVLKFECQDFRLTVEQSVSHKCDRCRLMTSRGVGKLCERCSAVLSDSWDL